MSIEKIQARFASGNSVSVDKAVVPASEWNAVMKEVSALRAALEQPVHEPVAWMWEFPSGDGAAFTTICPDAALEDGEDYVPLYTAPPDTEVLLRKALEALWHTATPVGEQAIAAIRKHLGETT